MQALCFTLGEFLSVHQHLLAMFETQIFCNKKKVTEHERLMFLAGVLFCDRFVDSTIVTKDHVEAQQHLRELAVENDNFGMGSLHEMHKFFCDNCAQGRDHGPTG